MAKKTQPLHVLIVGAGLTGLVLAQGLKKNGIPFTIFESEPLANLDRQREWGMSIQWAWPLLEDLLSPDLFNRIQSAAVDPYHIAPEQGNGMPVYDASTGEKVADVALVKFVRISRRKMRILCSEGLDVQYGKRLARMEREGGNVKVYFADGSSATGTLAIGADGANSALRAAAFHGNAAGHAEQFAYKGANLKVCYRDATVARQLRSALGPIMAVGVHPKGHWLWISIQDLTHPDHPEDWEFQLIWTFKSGSTAEKACIDPATGSLDLAAMRKEAVAMFQEPYRTAWEALPADIKLPLINHISVWDPRPIPDAAWNGQVALIGDAAHAMSFHRGQGLNHGIADADNLTKALTAVLKGNKSQEEAILTYETEMVKRAGEEVQVSRMNTEMMHDFEAFKEAPFMKRGGDKNK